MSFKVGFYDWGLAERDNHELYWRKYGSMSTGNICQTRVCHVQSITEINNYPVGMGLCIFQHSDQFANHNQADIDENIVNNAYLAHYGEGEGKLQKLQVCLILVWRKHENMSLCTGSKV